MHQKMNCYSQAAVRARWNQLTRLGERIADRQARRRQILGPVATDQRVPSPENRTRA